MPAKRYSLPGTHATVLEYIYSNTMTVLRYWGTSPSTTIIVQQICPSSFTGHSTRFCVIHHITAKSVSGNVSRRVLDHSCLFSLDAETTKWLLKEGKKQGRQMICTGSAMSEVVVDAFLGMQETEFKPKHTGSLENNYACFADFELC